MELYGLLRVHLWLQRGVADCLFVCLEPRAVCCLVRMTLDSVTGHNAHLHVLAQLHTFKYRFSRSGTHCQNAVFTYLKLVTV